MNIRRFNREGLVRYSEFLNSLRADSRTHVPREMLEDASLTENLGVDILIEPREFPRRFEAARYLYDLLHDRGLREPERDTGMWAWITLFFFDEVCPLERNGTRLAREHARLFPFVERYDRYYRHLLLGPYVLYAAHAEDPERALCVLANPVHKPGEVVAQFAARKFTATSAAVLRVCTTLYVENGSYKSGSQTGGSKQDPSGSPRRLSDWWSQIDRTYDLGTAKEGAMLGILPREFHRFMPRTSVVRELGDNSTRSRNGEGQRRARIRGRRR